jgi:hypothetical protein
MTYGKTIREWLEILLENGHLLPMMLLGDRYPDYKWYQARLGAMADAELADRFGACHGPVDLLQAFLRFHGPKSARPQPEGVKNAGDRVRVICDCGDFGDEWAIGKTGVVVEVDEDGYCEVRLDDETGSPYADPNNPDGTYLFGEYQLHKLD